ncbi:HNH endonuclease [Acinetobacter bereziniae]|uniref:HNH endonuclease n=1 Tax=Acinetobacter bereziniae TaxID=106648 RepID=UPI0021D1C44F|nr:HNH endonuclease [Acinetobacter bereziniae]MCU4316648.1 HNH endonuclease [Acinetobacter bereziniae]
MNRFNFTQTEVEYIKNHDINDSNYWDNTNEPMTSIRKKIRQHFLLAQNYQCCYCKMTKEEDHGLVWDVEHILPKILYPQFTFVPLNLAVSCKECNRSKWNNDIVVDKSKINTKYLSNSSNIAIIHPNLDKYEEHIQVIRYGENRIFHTTVNDSIKGRNTFHLCNLMRFLERAFSPAKQFKIDLYKHIDNAIQETIEEDTTPQEMSMIIKTAVNTAIR